jgi:hypothetical protein
MNIFSSKQATYIRSSITTIKVLSMAMLLIVLPIANASLAPVNQEAVRLSEPVVKDENSETFGAKLDMSLDLLQLTELINQAQEYQEKPFRLETKIAKVCQKKGCFFIAQQNDTVVRVSFKDYGFFIPSDSGNKIVMLTGTLIKKEVTDAQAAHFNDDLKDSDGQPKNAIKAGATYEIVADSIKIPLRS